MPEDDDETTIDDLIAAETPDSPQPIIPMVDKPVIVQPPANADVVAEPEKEMEDPREDFTDLTHLDDYDRNWLFGTSGVVEQESKDDISDLTDLERSDVLGEVTPEGKDELSDVTDLDEVDEDWLFNADDLLEPYPDENVDDLTGMKPEDIMNKPRRKQAKPRVSRPYNPPSSLGGVNYG